MKYNTQTTGTEQKMVTFRSKKTILSARNQNMVQQPHAIVSAAIRRDMKSEILKGRRFYILCMRTQSLPVEAVGG